MSYFILLLLLLYVFISTTVCFSRSQVHSFQGETVQVSGVRQGVLPVAHVGRAQDPPPGGVATQVSGVQPELQPAVQSEDAPVDAHRHQTVQLSDVQQSVPPELRSTPAQPHAQPVTRVRRRPAGVRRDHRTADSHRARSRQRRRRG